MNAQYCQAIYLLYKRCILDVARKPLYTSLGHCIYKASGVVYTMEERRANFLEK